MTAACAPRAAAAPPAPRLPPLPAPPGPTAWEVGSGSPAGPTLFGACVLEQGRGLVLTWRQGPLLAELGSDGLQELLAALAAARPDVIAFPFSVSVVAVPEVTLPATQARNWRAAETLSDQHPPAMAPWRSRTFHCLPFDDLVQAWALDDGTRLRQLLLHTC